MLLVEMSLVLLAARLVVVGELSLQLIGQRLGETWHRGQRVSALKREVALGKPTWAELPA